MHPLLVEQARKFDHLRTAKAITYMRSELQSTSGMFSGAEQETGAGLIGRLRQACL